VSVCMLRSCHGMPSESTAKCATLAPCTISYSPQCTSAWIDGHTGALLYVYVLNDRLLTCRFRSFQHQAAAAV
jgi:hypothetical protein